MNGREGTEEKNRLGRGRMHTVELVNRETATFTGVTDVEAFNEDEVVLLTELGVIVLAGEGLHITKLNLDDGLLVAEGHIIALEYVQEQKGGKKAGMLSGLFK